LAATSRLQREARAILRDMLGEIMLSPAEDGSLWAQYAMKPATLPQVAGALSGK
jgi:hypothetical protein